MWVSPQKLYVQQKEADTKKDILNYSIRMKLRTDKTHLL